MKRKLLSILICLSVLLTMPLYTTGCTPPNNTLNTQKQEQANDIFEPASKLTLEIEEYMAEKYFDYDHLPFSLNQKIDKIRAGAQIYYLDFASSNTYFVAAYHTNGTEHDANIVLGFDSCDEEYLWIGFSKADIIPEQYDNKKIVAAFQINKSSTCLDVLGEETRDRFAEHFMQLNLSFIDGMNTSLGVQFNEHFIFVDEVGDSDIYCCSDSVIFYQKKMDCIKINGTAFYCKEMYWITPTGERVEGNYAWDFGIYYDSIMIVLIQDGYLAESTSGTGSITHYGLVDFENLRLIIRGKE